MVNFISLLLFSISTNLDNIPVGISYSLNNKKIKFKSRTYRTRKRVFVNYSSCI